MTTELCEQSSFGQEVVKVNASVLHINIKTYDLPIIHQYIK